MGFARMLSTVSIFCLALAAAAPSADPYFKNLSRELVEQVEVSSAKGPVILIVVDALRPDRMTPYGSKRDTTPHLNALANEGILFTNYFVNGNWTRPSTATMLTGLPPAKHGVESERDRLADGFVTLGEVLRKEGVPTGAVVGNGNAGSAFGLGRGFDFYADTVKHWRGLPSADQVVELSLPFVRKHRKDPFFLMLFFVDPHDPYHAPGEYENMFVEDKSVRLIRTPHWELGKYTPAELERMVATYDGAVRYTDAALGRFFDALRKEGVYDEATIIVTSDHGEAFGEHGVFLHSHHFYDEIVRTPLIIKAPGMSRRGGYNRTLFQTLDIFPTVVGRYGGKARGGGMGIDILDFLSAPKGKTGHRWVICEFNNFGIRRRMLRTYKEKIVYEQPADREAFRASVGRASLLPSVSFDAARIKMFDLEKDPFEKTNIYSKKLEGDPRWAELLRYLKTYRAPKSFTTGPSIAESLDKETLRDLKALGYIQ